MQRLAIDQFQAYYIRTNKYIDF